MLILLSDAFHNIRHTVFDFFLDTLDAFLLFIGQVEPSIQCVCTAAVNLDELRILEKLLFRDEAGTGSKILLSPKIIFHKVVSVG